MWGVWGAEGSGMARQQTPFGRAIVAVAMSAQSVRGANGYGLWRGGAMTAKTFTTVSVFCERAGQRYRAHAPW